MTSTEFQQLMRAAQSPWYFMTEFVKTLDPKAGVRDFPAYPFVHKLVFAECANRFLLVPKSRQMFVTWTILACFLWRALFKGPGIYLFLSRNERCAEELIARLKLMLEHLPPFMQPDLSANSRQELGFGKLGSRIFSLPATPDGPRMYSPSGVFWDEMAFTPYDRHIWSALQPALMSGGRFVGVSSSGGARNFFADLVKDAPSGNGGVELAADDSLFHIHRIHYSMHPERGNDEWKREWGKGLSDLQWQREQEINFEVSEDLVYSEFDPVLHILSENWRANPDWPLYRSIDFGYRNPFVLWIQKTPAGGYVVFDEWAGKNATTSQMLDAMRRIDAVHGVTESDFHWTACDPAGAAAQDSGLSPVDYLRQNGVKLTYRSSRILPGIEQIKSALCDVQRNVSLRFSLRCRKLIQDIASYRWAAGGEEPLKDGDCDHSLDALRYFFVNHAQPDEIAVQPRIGSFSRA